MPSFGVLLFTLQLVLLNFANAAVINPSSNLLLTNTGVFSAALPNASLTYNQTISEPFQYVNTPPPRSLSSLTHTPSNLPPSPYIYPIPHYLSTVITFSEYTNPISVLSAVECILFATEDVAEALDAAIRAGDPQPLLQQTYIRLEAEHATLSMRKINGQLKWVTWGQTLKALRLFLDRWEFVGLRFVIQEGGLRVATGVLAGR